MGVRKYVIVCLIVLLVFSFALYNVIDTFGLSVQTLQEPTDWMKAAAIFHNSNISELSPMLERYGLNKTMPRISRTLPVIVTGCDSSHYFESQGHIRSLDRHVRPKYPDFKLIYYDLGLTPRMRALVTKHCNCEVRSFPFDKYPAHVRDLGSYAFKPIIIKTVMQEHGSVWWMDSSIRIADANISEALQRLNNDNFVCYSVQDLPHGTPVWTTSERMFEYFNVPPSFYLQFREVEGGYIMFKASDVTDIILKLGATCALIKDCIAPPGSHLDCPTIRETIFKEDVGKCHRYDQAMWNILYWRTFPHPRSMPRPSWLTVERGSNVFFYFGV